MYDRGLWDCSPKFKIYDKKKSLNTPFLLFNSPIWLLLKPAINEWRLISNYGNINADPHY